MQSHTRDLPRQFEISGQGLTNSAANTKVGLNLQTFMQQSQYSQQLGVARSSRTSTLKGEARKNKAVPLGGLSSKINNLNQENGAEQIDFEKSHRSRGNSDKEQPGDPHRCAVADLSGVCGSQGRVQRHASVLDVARNEDGVDYEEPQMLPNILPQNQSPRSLQTKDNHHFTMIIESHPGSREDVLSQGCPMAKVSSLTPATEDAPRSRNQQMKRPRSQGAGPRGRKFLSKQVAKKAHMMPKAKSSVRDGIASFIAKSNIDIDQLSANLSQKQEKMQESNRYKRASDVNSTSQRSGSHRSGYARSGNSKAPFTSAFQQSSALPSQAGPGLPRPSKSNSQRLADQYRRQSQGRKSKHGYQPMNERDLVTPEQQTRKALPDPVPHPNLLKEQSFTQVNSLFGQLTNEDTFQQLQMQASSNGRQLTMDLLQSQASSRLKLHNHKNSSPNFCHPNTFQRTPKRNELEEELSPDATERTGLLVSVNNIQKSPVGTIVKLPQHTRQPGSRRNDAENVGEYSTFGELIRATQHQQNEAVGSRGLRPSVHVNYRSDSQIAFGAESVRGESSLNLSRQYSAASPRSQARRPGVIVRQQRNHSANSSRDHGKIVRTTNGRNRSQQNRIAHQAFGLGTGQQHGHVPALQVADVSPQHARPQAQARSCRAQPEQRPPLHQAGNVVHTGKSRRCCGSEVSYRSEPEHFREVFMRGYVSDQRDELPVFKDPLYDNLWDCFKLENLKNVQERLKGKVTAVNEYYEHVKSELQEYSVGHEYRHQNWSDGLLIFMHGQAIVKVLRAATKILQKERLLLTVQELADLKLKLLEKQSLLKEVMQESMRLTVTDTKSKSSEEEDSDEEREVTNLKAGLLQNIISILTQRLVLFSLQLRVYEREETQIVFEELWEDHYRAHVERAYFKRFKMFLEKVQIDKQRQLAAVEHMNEFRMAQVFKAWHQARPTRIAYQTRVLRVTQLLAHKKQRQIFLTLQFNIKLKVAHRLDKRLLKKYLKYRSHHKLFLEWKIRQKRLTEAKEVAVEVLHGHRSLQYHSMLEKADFETCKALMFDDSYHALQLQRKNNNEKIMSILEKIRGFNLKRACVNTLEAPLQPQHHAQSCMAVDRPTDLTAFPSFIKAQNPNAFSEVGTDSQEAMSVKYDIHALLVDAQNYYLQEQGGGEQQQEHQLEGQDLIKHRQLALIRYDRAKMQQQNEARAQSSRATDMPRIIDYPEYDRQPLPSLKAPNQLFERLERKLQMKQNQSSAPGHNRLDCNGRAQLAQMICRIKKEIRTVVEKLAAERNLSEEPSVYRRYYSFAVRYLFSKQSNNHAALAHLSFSPQKLNYMQASNDKPFTMSLNQVEDLEEYQDFRQDQSIVEDQTVNGQDQSGLVMSHEEEDQEYEDTERSNQRLQRERQCFIQNNEDEQYKFIGDGYAGQGQDDLEDEEQSFVESTPGREASQLSQVDQNQSQHYRPHQDRQHRRPNVMGLSGAKAESNVAANQEFPREQRRSTFTNMHGPSMSLMSKFSLAKDAYTLEDYVQMAQSRQQLPEQLQILMEYIEANNQHIYEEDDQSERSCGTSEENDLHSASAPERHIFVILNMAKNMAKLFTEWRIAYLRRRLENLVESLVSLQSNCQGSFIHQENSKLLSKCLTNWRTLPRYLDEKAQIFSSVHQNVRFFSLFRAWRDASWNLRVLENQRIAKQRKRSTFRAWQSALSDFYEQKSKARSYHSQALCSKALLTMYIFASRRRKMKDFQKRTAFRKFFKRAWKHQFERHRKLRVVMKMMYKKSAEWERTRYQREFDQIVKAVEVWKSKVNDRRRLIKNYNALSQYRSTLLIKSFQRWKKVVLVKHGLRRLNSLVARSCYRPAVERLLEVTLSHQRLQRDWLQHRQRFVKQQIIVRLREYIVKKKLANMFFKRLILSKLKRYVFGKNKTIPHQFWSRYRQILFFKILRYQAHKSRKRAQKQRVCVKQIQSYQMKLLRKCFLAMLDQMIRNKKNNIIGSTVTSFRCHQLRKKTFRQLKISYLNKKKNAILMKVANDFRQDKLVGNMAFMNPKPIEKDCQEPLDSSELRTKNKIMLQKVYTTWLQYTLDNFIKKKVLKRFQSYQDQKLMEKVFKALRQDELGRLTGLPKRVDEEKEMNELHNVATFRNSHDKQSYIDSEVMYQGGFNPGCRPNMANHRESQYLDSQSSQRDPYQEQTPCSGFVESSFGGATPLKSSHGHENRPLALPVRESTPAGTLGDESCRVQDNQQLFQELDDIFKKNQQWMQEQKNKQLHIFGDLPTQQNPHKRLTPDLQESQASAENGLLDSVTSESQLDLIREKQRQLQLRYQQLDAASNDSSFVHTKTETQILDLSRNSKILLAEAASKMQDSQLSLLSSMSSKNPRGQEEKMKLVNGDHLGAQVARTSACLEGNVNSSQQIRGFSLPNQAVQSAVNQSVIVDSLTQKDRANDPEGIPTFKRKKDGPGSSLQLPDSIRPPNSIAQLDQQMQRNTFLHWSQSNQADSKQIEPIYLEQIESSNAGGHEKTLSGSANKEGSLLVGGLVLSGSAANLSHENNEAVEEEALVYSNQSSNKNPSTTLNLKSSRPTLTTGPTITLRNHPIATVRQDTYQRISQPSQMTRHVQDSNSHRSAGGPLPTDVNSSRRTPQDQARKSSNGQIDQSLVQRSHSSSHLSMTTEEHLHMMKVRDKQATGSAARVEASDAENDDGQRSRLKSLSFSDLAREMQHQL